MRTTLLDVGAAEAACLPGSRAADGEGGNLDEAMKGKDSQATCICSLLDERRGLIGIPRRGSARVREFLEAPACATSVPDGAYPGCDQPVSLFGTPTPA